MHKKTDPFDLYRLYIQILKKNSEVIKMSIVSSDYDVESRLIYLAPPSYFGPFYLFNRCRMNRH